MHSVREENSGASKEERAGSRNLGNPWAGQRIPSGVAKLMRGADVVRALPGATAGYLTVPQEH